MDTVLANELQFPHVIYVYSKSQVPLEVLDNIHVEKGGLVWLLDMNPALFCNYM